MSARGRRVLLLGGSSEIGLAIVRELAGSGAIETLLAGRDAAALARAAGELRASGCRAVSTLDSLQASNTDSHAQLLDEAFSTLGGVDVAVLAVGVLGDRRPGLPADIPAALQVLRVNLEGAASLLMGTATRMQAAGGGAIVVLSSASAVRPRRATAVYGASKAGIDSLAQALSDDLHGSGVEVMVVRPGFVRTRMTSGLSAPPLSCDPRDVARLTVAGLRRGAQTVWAPPAMRWAMLALRLLPRAVFRRLPL